MNRYKPYEHLRHKSYDKKYDYQSIRDACYETCQDCERPTHKKTETVHWVLYEYSSAVDSGGMEKAILLIGAMLYSIDKDEVYDELQEAVESDIADLKTGNYDDLFTDEDLQYLKADISKIENYIKNTHV